MNTTETEKQIEQVCKENGLTFVKLSNFPTWITEDKTEGIEYKASKIIPFVIKDLSRIYNTVPSEKIQKVLDSLSLGDNKKSNKKSEETVKESSGVLVPETITKPLIEKWEKMRTIDRLLLFQKTPKDLIKYKKKSLKEIPYIEGNIMQTEANIIFLYQWSDKVDTTMFTDTGAVVIGSVKANLDEKEIIHSAVGIDTQEFTKDNKPIFTQEQLLKNAHMDMIKKALSKFGINLDIYRGDV